MVELTKKELLARNRICLALDNIKSTEAAFDLAYELSDYVGMFKIGKELHIIAGNEGTDIISIGIISKRPGSVFLDLKLHDTPNTVFQASLNSVRPEVYMFNVHLSGGEAMCRKAMEGAEKGFDNLEKEVKKGLARPKVIGVTMLTSLNDNDLETLGFKSNYSDQVLKMAELAVKWGLDGIVCPAKEAGKMEKRFGSSLLYVTPGIEWGGVAGAGQKQLYDPVQAIKDCNNSILVIGSAITKAPNSAQTAYEIVQAMAKHI